MADSPAPTRLTEPIWLEPYPDLLLEEIPDRNRPRAAITWFAVESGSRLPSHGSKSIARIPFAPRGCFCLQAGAEGLRACARAKRSWWSAWVLLVLGLPAVVQTAVFASRQRD